MTEKTIQGRTAEPVRQFSVFTANRLGRLHDLTNLLGSQQAWKTTKSPNRL